jgi:hypothetical protein
VKVLLRLLLIAGAFWLVAGLVPGIAVRGDLVDYLVIGVAVFSGAFSGLSAAFDWWRSKEIKVDWDKLQTLLLSWSVIPPAALGLLTGLYVRMKTPRGGGGGKK